MEGSPQDTAASDTAVRTRTGVRAKTIIPRPRAFAARFSVSRYRVILLTTYADSIGIAASPALEQMLMIRPLPRLSIPGRTVRVQ